MSEESEIDKAYRKDIIELTLFLYKSEYVKNREGVDVLIKVFDDFIKKSTLKYIQKKANLLGTQKRKNDDDLKVILFETERSFRCVDTEKKRFAIYPKKYSFLEPKEFTVGLKDDVKISTQVPITAVHLPLSHQLRVVLQIPGFLDQIIRYEK